MSFPEFCQLWKVFVSTYFIIFNSDLCDENFLLFLTKASKRKFSPKTLEVIVSAEPHFQFYFINFPQKKKFSVENSKIYYSTNSDSYAKSIFMIMSWFRFHMQCH